MPGYLKTEQESFSRLALFLTHLQIISTEKIRGGKKVKTSFFQVKKTQVYSLFTLILVWKEQSSSTSWLEDTMNKSRSLAGR